ncbi:type 1 glutamine amidotransferase domain-containing protein [Palleronia pelagia]|uniref:Protease I n=1 Tax=Palleronia pelagia TaxID=387096 RepID=A0A1H8K335_9RHOB|nr:type 1 glutamine amidotransferase domain-containing protein [Palleronia pelagia]SEN87077.1 protease I [Palleronia pelagia]
MPKIDTAKILIIASDGFEQSELMEPKKQLSEAGATVHVATPDGDAITGWDETDWGEKVAADVKISETDISDYDAVVLPGGQINPDVLRLNEDAVARIRDFGMSGKPLAAICHAPWLLIEAGLVKGKRLTAYPSIRTDLRNAGAEVVDETVAQDGNLITSRNPGDLDAFCRAIIEAVEAGDARDHAA